jgi:hypothetical protein
MQYKIAKRKPIQQEIQLIYEIAGYYQMSGNELESLVPICLRKLGAVANREMRLKGEYDHPYHKFGIWTIQKTIDEFIQISNIGTSFSAVKSNF